MTDGIGRASAFLASGTIVSRILGFVKAIIVAATIGVVGSAGADAFAVANALPNTVYVIVAGGVLSAVLVPQIVRAGAHADGGSGYINKLLTVALVILAGATILATALAPLLTLVYGATLPQATLDLAIAFAWWCLPQIFFYGLYTLLGEVLNARRSFGPFTWVPVLNNIVAIAGLLVFAWAFGVDPDGARAADEWTPAMIAVLAGTATLGIAVQALVLFWFWRRIGLRYRPDFAWRGVGLGTAGRMAGWTFGMLLLTTLAGIVQTLVLGTASGQNASIAAVDYAWLIFMLPHSVITVSIATAYFTRMSEHAAADDLDRVRDDLSGAIRGITLIIILAAAVLLVIAYPFAAVFETASYADTAALGNVVIAFTLGLVPFSTLFVVQRTFYALGDTRTPFRFTLFQVIVFIAGALACLALPKDVLAAGIALDHDDRLHRPARARRVAAAASAAHPRRCPRRARVRSVVPRPRASTGRGHRAARAARRNHRRGFRGLGHPRLGRLDGAHRLGHGGAVLRGALAAALARAARVRRAAREPAAARLTGRPLRHPPRAHPSHSRRTTGRVE